MGVSGGHASRSGSPSARSTSRGDASVALAFAACVLAVAMRSQLAALFGALAAGLLALWWRSDRMRRWRATWTTWDRVGAACSPSAR